MLYKYISLYLKKKRHSLVSYLFIKLRKAWKKTHLLHWLSVCTCTCKLWDAEKASSFWETLFGCLEKENVAPLLDLRCQGLSTLQLALPSPGCSWVSWSLRWCHVLRSDQSRRQTWPESSLPSLGMVSVRQQGVPSWSRVRSRHQSWGCPSTLTILIFNSYTNSSHCKVN